MMVEKYDPGMNVFMNLSDCISIRFRFELKSYIEFVKKNVILKSPIQVAYITCSPNQNFLLKIWKPIASIMKIEIFSNKELGLYCLNLNQDQQSIFW